MVSAPASPSSVASQAGASSLLEGWGGAGGVGGGARTIAIALSGRGNEEEALELPTRAPARGPPRASLQPVGAGAAAAALKPLPHADDSARDIGTGRLGWNASAAKGSGGGRLRCGLPATEAASVVSAAATSGAAVLLLRVAASRSLGAAPPFDASDGGSPAGAGLASPLCTPWLLSSSPAPPSPALLEDTCGAAANSGRSSRCGSSTGHCRLCCSRAPKLTRGGGTPSTEDPSASDAPPLPPPPPGSSPRAVPPPPVTLAACTS